MDLYDIFSRPRFQNFPDAEEDDLSFKDELKKILTYNGVASLKKDIPLSPDYAIPKPKRRSLDQAFKRLGKAFGTDPKTFKKEVGYKD